MLPDVSVPMAASSQSYEATATALPAEDEEQYCQPSPRGLKGARTSILKGCYFIKDQFEHGLNIPISGRVFAISKLRRLDFANNDSAQVN